MATYDNIKFTDGVNILFIGTNKVDENYNNPVKTFTTPTVGISLSTGTTTSTTASKLVDNIADFTTDKVAAGNKVINTTDNTSTTVSAVDSATTLSLSSDIFVSGENYNVKAEVSPNTSLSINLNKLEDRFTINGYLPYGKLDNTDTWTSGKDKKDGFKEMINNGSTITMTYESKEYNLTVEKFQITYVAKDNTDSVDGELVYEITITGIVSDDVV